MGFGEGRGGFREGEAVLLVSINQKKKAIAEKRKREREAVPPLWFLVKKTDY